MTVEEIPGELFSRFPLGIVLVDEAGTVTRISREASEALGHAPGSLVGTCVDDLVGRHHGLVESLKRLAPGTERRTSFRVRQASGSERELGLTLVAFETGAPPFAYALIVGDLGRLREVELDVRRFELLGSSLRITSGLAHVLRNPLAAILGFAELLSFELPRDSVHCEDAERILAMVGRIDGLISSCMRLSPSGARRIEVDPLIVVGAASAALAARFPGLPAPGLAIDEPPPPLFVDREQAVEALSALFENAVEAAGGDGARFEVAISVERGASGPPYVRLAVRDAGPGWDGLDPARLFDPFFTTKPGHVGLGLAVAQALAVENRGFIEAAGRPGTTTFSLVLPAAGPGRTKAPGAAESASP